MNNINDKELLLEAINYTRYTPKQKKLLKLFLNIEIDGVVSITPNELAHMLDTSLATIYFNLNRLLKDGYINNITAQNKRFNKFMLNCQNLENFVLIYKKKKDYLKIIQKTT